MLRRSAGFDVPDMLAAGPRDILVARVGRGHRSRGPAPGRADRRRTPAPRAAAPARRSRLLAGLLVALALGALVALAGARWRAARPCAHAAPARRARCERQAPSVCTRSRPPKARVSAARGPCGMQAAAELRRRPLALPRGPAGRSRFRRAAAASRRPGGKLGRPPSRRRRAIAGRACSVWPAEPARRSLQQPRPAHRAPVADQAHRPWPGRRLFSAITRRAYRHAARAVEHLARPGDVRGPGAQRRRGEDVQLVGARPAGDVAPCRRRRQQPRERQQRVGAAPARPGRRAGRP